MAGANRWSKGCVAATKTIRTDHKGTPMLGRVALAGHTTLLAALILLKVFHVFFSTLKVREGIQHCILAFLSLVPKTHWLLKPPYEDK